MSEQTPQSGPTSTESTTGASADATEAYDAGQDQDADPDSLQPRTGGRASGASDQEDPDYDPDADPEMLNPRDGAEASAAAADD